MTPRYACYRRRDWVNTPLLICFSLNVAVIPCSYVVCMTGIIMSSKFLGSRPTKNTRDFFFCIALARYTNFAIQIFGFPSLPLLFTSEKNENTYLWKMCCKMPNTNTKYHHPMYRKSLQHPKGFPSGPPPQY